jgi:hypothetical protein
MKCQTRRHSKQMSRLDFFHAYVAVAIALRPYANTDQINNNGMHSALPSVATSFFGTECIR